MSRDNNHKILTHNVEEHYQSLADLTVVDRMVQPQSMCTVRKPFGASAWLRGMRPSRKRTPVVRMGKEKELCVRACPRVRARVWNVHAPLMGEDQ